MSHLPEGCVCLQRVQRAPPLGEEHRASKFASMTATERKYAVARLSGNLDNTTTLFRKHIDEGKKLTRSSYEVSRLLARRMKPFSDGDFSKECLVTVVDSVCPEQRSAVEKVSLLSRTIRRHIEEMSDNVHDSLKNMCSTLVAFSLALDESTDTNDTAQLAVLSVGSPLTYRCLRSFSNLSLCVTPPMDKIYLTPCFGVWSSSPSTSPVSCV